MKHSNFDAIHDAHRRDFTRLARLLMLAKGSLKSAALMEHDRQSSIIQSVLTRSDPGSIGGSSPTGWAGQIADYRLLASAFLASLRSVGAFDAMLPSMKPMPFRTKMVVSTTAIVSTDTDEAELKSVTELDLDAEQLDVKKTATTVVVSEDLLRLAPVAESVIETELRNGTVAGTDKGFLDLMIAGTTPVGSQDDVLLDMGSMMSTIDSGNDAAFFVVMTPDQAKQIATQPSLAGGVAFPSMSAKGGVIGGVTVLVSDQLSDGVVLMLDASQIGAIAEGISINASNQADIVMNAGSSPENTVSLWQRNLHAIRAERWWGATILRSGAVKSVTGANYSYASSPA